MQVVVTENATTGLLADGTVVNTFYEYYSGKLFRNVREWKDVDVLFASNNVELYGITKDGEFTSSFCSNQDTFRETYANITTNTRYVAEAEVSELSAAVLYHTAEELALSGDYAAASAMFGEVGNRWDAASLCAKYLE